MKSNRSLITSFVVAVFMATLVAARSHCDGMDGPVVKAAQQALAENNVNLALIWVPKADEREVTGAFEKTLAVRKLGIEARELADRYFFETVVRIHRAGEGVPYTGLKPAGRDLGPVIPAADKAITTGDIRALRGLLSEELGSGLQVRFREAIFRRNFDKNDLKAGRDFVRAYGEYLQYVEGIHQATRRSAYTHPGEAESTTGHDEKLLSWH